MSGLVPKYIYVYKLDLNMNDNLAILVHDKGALIETEMPPQAIPATSESQ